MIYFVTASLFGQGAKLDKNGLPAIYLSSINGAQLPERAKVMSGTVAQRSGIELNSSYLINITEAGTTEYGVNYSYTVMQKLGIQDIMLISGMNPVVNRPHVAAPTVAAATTTTEDSNLP